jgi:hypothetical protein
LDEGGSAAVYLRRRSGDDARLGRVLSRGFAIALGIVIGALAAVLGSRARDLDPFADARHTDLEKRVRAIEVGSPSKGAARSVVPPEVQAKLHRELHAARIARHDREQLDPEWSAATTKLVVGQLDAEAVELKYKVSRVDCRSVSCVVSLEWPSRSASLPAESALVRSLVDMPCTREVLFDDAPDPSGKIGATMVLECERPATSSAK